MQPPPTTAKSAAIRTALTPFAFIKAILPQQNASYARHPLPDLRPVLLALNSLAATLTDAEMK
jgi:hypothetical protein